MPPKRDERARAVLERLQKKLAEAEQRKAAGDAVELTDKMVELSLGDDAAKTADTTGRPSDAEMDEFKQSITFEAKNPLRSDTGEDLMLEPYQLRSSFDQESNTWSSAAQNRMSKDFVFEVVAEKLGAAPDLYLTFSLFVNMVSDMPSNFWRWFKLPEDALKFASAQDANECHVVRDSIVVDQFTYMYLSTGVRRETITFMVALRKPFAVSNSAGVARLPYATSVVFDRVPFGDDEKSALNVAIVNETIARCSAFLRKRYDAYIEKGKEFAAASEAAKSTPTEPVTAATEPIVAEPVAAEPVVAETVAAEAVATEPVPLLSETTTTTTTTPLSDTGSSLP